VAALAVTLVLLGAPMHALFPHGTARCAVLPTPYDCRLAVTQLQQGYGYATPMLILFNLVPFAIGAFLGAPLLAREWESGTWQLAWTQAVPRMRWLTTKLAALGALTVLLTGAFAVLVSWYREPLNLFGRFEIDGFDVSGIVPPAYALFAFALGVSGGVLLRRSLPALGTALVAFVAVRVTVAGWLRPHYRVPVTTVVAIPAGSGEVSTAAANLQDGIIDQGVSGPTGHHLSDLAVSMVEHQARDAGIDPTTYLHDHGYQRWVTYQPAGRFWTFQLIEAAIFVGLAAVLLAATVWRVKRRAY
jgi:hypothetical protein